MKKILEKVITICILILIFSMCRTCAISYIEGGDNEAIANYEKLLRDNSIVSAEYYPEYKETTIKIMKIPTKVYDFNYFFTVNNTKYEGKRTLYQLPESLHLKVYYLKTDPKFNTATPEEDLKAEKEKNSSNKDLYWAIGWGIFGMLTLIGVIREIAKELKDRKLKNIS
ncbi:hypothetical protein O2K51_00280 [Apibacter raozihei]|uniref:hypothetical protein n=1 Tax=Apibacter raozihei TaxID=2500547 RepID=UPI000FE432F3|nr:hypothetical protein [Apibacter raozihei]